MFIDNTALAHAYIGANLAVSIFHNKQVDLKSVEIAALQALKPTFDRLSEKGLRGSPIYKQAATLINDELNRRSNLASSSTGG